MCVWSVEYYIVLNLELVINQKKHRCKYKSSMYCLLQLLMTTPGHDFEQ